MPLRDHPATHYITQQNREKVMENDEIDADLCTTHACKDNAGKNKFMVFGQETIKSVNKNFPDGLIHAAPDDDPADVRFLFSCDFSI